MQYQLRISGKHHNILWKHLFPGDGKEAVAIGLCGHHSNKELHIMLVHEVFCVPHSHCERSPNYVHWQTDSIIHLLEKAAKKKFTIVKFHSHPTGYSQFSELDNESDGKLFPSVFGWIDGDHPHASAVMLPNAKLFGRVYTTSGVFHTLQKISVVGDSISIWNKKDSIIDEEISKRNIQTFGLGTSKLLKGMKIGVVGASGTGSPTIEQLSRLGVGELVIVDAKLVEKKNLNRILNTYKEHSIERKYKVDVLSESIAKIGFDTKVKVFKKNLYESKKAILELISCDFIFGCVDSIDGRYLLNQISTFYLVPYIDIGVKLEADKSGGINQVNGAVHYIQPGGSSLMSRGVYSAKGLESASLMRQNPEEFERRAKEKYIVNLPVESPAVISINMQVSSFAVNEFLDRIHPFKGTDQSERAIHWINISEDIIFSEPDGLSDDFLEQRVGRGDTTPFLHMPEL